MPRHHLVPQMTRSWRFRTEMEELANVAARQRLEAVGTPERIRDFLQRRGEPSRPKDIAVFAERFRGENAPRLWLGQARAVQESLRFAIEVVTPEIFLRRWGLRVFERPVLLTSDEPIALWTPGRTDDPSPGVATAQVMWWPLDRRHALTFSLGPGEEVVRESPISRARRINLLVASQAQRWIFHHPEDEGLDGIELPSRSRFVEALADVSVTGDEVRALYRVVKRQPPPLSSG